MHDESLLLNCLRSDVIPTTVCINVESRQIPVQNLRFRALIAIEFFDMSKLFTCNMKYYRLISLIFILYHIVVYTRDVSSTKIHNLQPFTSIKFNYPNYNIRSARQLKEIDLSTNSKALTEQNHRDSRGVSGSNRHLKLGDAHQVANYFLTGGPLKGHAHFVRDCDSNDDDNDTEETSNPTIKTNADLLINEQDSNTTSSDSIVGAPLPHIPRLPHIPPVPHIPSVPHIPPLPIPPHLNSVIHPALNTISRLPHLLGNNFLQSVLHPDLHPHINTLHDIPSTLVKTVSGPVSDLINARSELQDMLHPNGSFLRSINEALENRKARKNLKNNLMFPTGQPPIVGLAQPNVPLSSMIEPHLPVSHPPPSGYIVHYVPHDTETALQSTTDLPK